MFGERQVRLAFLANAVQVSPTQHPRLHQMWADVHRTLDAPAEYPLYVTQNPTYNAAALGMDKPFVIVHSSWCATSPTTSCASCWATRWGT